jgi:hypothetical protein
MLTVVYIDIDIVVTNPILITDLIIAVLGSVRDFVVTAPIRTAIGALVFYVRATSVSALIGIRSRNASVGRLFMPSINRLSIGSRRSTGRLIGTSRGFGSTTTVHRRSRCGRTRM